MPETLIDDQRKIPQILTARSLRQNNIRVIVRVSASSITLHVLYAQMSPTPQANFRLYFTSHENDTSKPCYIVFVISLGQLIWASFFTGITHTISQLLQTP